MSSGHSCGRQEMFQRAQDAETKPSLQSPETWKALGSALCTVADCRIGAAFFNNSYSAGTISTGETALAADYCREAQIEMGLNPDL